MVYRKMLATWMCMGLLALAGIRADAALLAAPDRVPSDAMLVISVSDATSLWTALKQTSLYDAGKALFNLPAVQNDPDFQSTMKDLKAVEERLGMSLDPDNLFTKTLLGADFAMGFRQGRDEPDILFVLKCKDAKIAESFLKQIEAEGNKAPAPAPAESGSDGAAPAPTPAAKSTYQTIAGQKVLVVPAEGMWATQQDNLLILASSAEMMNKSLTTTAATSVATTAFVKQGLAAIGDTAGAQSFFLIDYMGIMKAVGENNPEMMASLKAMEAYSDVHIVGLTDVAADHLRVRLFSPNPSNDPILAELAATYPPSSMTASKLIPAASMGGFAFNNFDGPKYFELMMKTLSEVAATANPGTDGGAAAKAEFKKQVDDALVQFESLMGFKFKEDLLVALGPEGEVNIENFAFNPLMGPYPNIDITFGFQIRDKQKLDLVLGKLEEFLTAKLPAMMGAGEPGTKFTMKELVFGDVKGKALVLPQLPTYAIGWVILDNKYVVIGTTENSMKHATEGFRGTTPSFKTSPDYAKVKPYLPEKANFEMVAGVRAITEFLSNILMMVAPQAVQGDEGAVLMAALDIVKTVNTAYASAVVNGKGDKVSTMVFSLAPVAPAQPAAPAKSAEDNSTK